MPDAGGVVTIGDDKEPNIQGIRGTLHSREGRYRIPVNLP